MRISRLIVDQDCRMFVLDVLKYDIEQIGSIVNLLNDDTCIGYQSIYGRPFHEPEVMRWLTDLASDGQVEVCQEEGGYLVPVKRIPLLTEQTLGDHWFRLTGAGRESLEHWDPPLDLDVPPDE